VQAKINKLAKHVQFKKRPKTQNKGSLTS